MEYVYAALLLEEAGKKIDEKAIMDVVKAAGMEPDEAQAKALVASLKGVDIKEVLKNAQAAPVQAAPSAPAAAPAKEAEKKENKEDQAKREEEAAGGLASLFGGA
jgi:large subunit ribosomal protein L12